MSDLTHEVRHKDGGTVVITNYTKNRAIKAMCTECLGFGEVHPKDCTSPLCPLFPFLGKMNVTISPKGCNQCTPIDPKIDDDDESDAE